MHRVSNTVTVLDIKTEVQKSCNIKWQNRWAAGAKGRQLFEFFAVRTIPNSYSIFTVASWIT